jgi:hypothetical protein
MNVPAALIPYTGQLHGIVASTRGQTIGTGLQDFLESRINQILNPIGLSYCFEFNMGGYTEHVFFETANPENSFRPVQLVSSDASAPGDKEYLQLACEALSAKLPDNHGFILLVAPTGTTEPGKLRYASNLGREDALHLLRQFHAHVGDGTNWMKHTQ